MKLQCTVLGLRHENQGTWVSHVMPCSPSTVDICTISLHPSSIPDNPLAFAPLDAAAREKKLASLPVTGSPKNNSRKSIRLKYCKLGNYMATCMDCWPMFPVIQERRLESAMHQITYQQDGGKYVCKNDRQILNSRILNSQPWSEVEEHNNPWVPQPVCKMDAHFHFLP